MNTENHHVAFDNEASDVQKVNKLVEKGKRQTISRVTHTLQLLEQMRNESSNDAGGATDNLEENIDKLSISRKELELNKLRELVAINRKNALFYDIDQTDIKLDDIDEILKEDMSKEKFSQLYKVLLDIYKPPQESKPKNITKGANINLPNITIVLKVLLDDLTIKQRVIKSPYDSLENLKNKVLQKLPQNVIDLKEKLVFYIPSSGIYLNEERSLCSYLLKDNDELILRLRNNGTPESIIVQVQNDDIATQTINFYPQTTVFGILQALNKEYNDKWKKEHYHLLWNQKSLRKNETLYSYGIKNGSILVLIKKKGLIYEEPAKNNLLKLKLTVTSPEANKEIVFNEFPDTYNISSVIKESFMKISLENSNWNEYGIFLDNNIGTWIDDSYPIEYLIKNKINYVYLLLKPEFGLRKIEIVKEPFDNKPSKKKKSSKQVLNKGSLQGSSGTEKKQNSKKRIKLYEIAIEILVPNSKKIAKKIRLSKKETGKKIKSLLQTFVPEDEDLNDYIYVLPFVGNIEMPEQCTIIPFLKAYLGDKPITLSDRIQLIKNKITSL